LKVLDITSLTPSLRAKEPSCPETPKLIAIGEKNKSNETEGRTIKKSMDLVIAHYSQMNMEMWLDLLKTPMFSERNPRTVVYKQELSEQD
jgi:hypothetical protein